MKLHSTVFIPISFSPFPLCALIRYFRVIRLNALLWALIIFGNWCAFTAFMVSVTNKAPSSFAAKQIFIYKFGFSYSTAISTKPVFTMGCVYFTICSIHHILAMEGIPISFYLSFAPHSVAISIRLNIVVWVIILHLARLCTAFSFVISLPLPYSSRIGFSCISYSVVSVCANVSNKKPCFVKR